jgi:hypothetical protein
MRLAAAKQKVVAAGNLAERISQRKTIGLGEVAKEHLIMAQAAWALGSNEVEVKKFFAEASAWALAAIQYGDYCGPVDFVMWFAAAGMGQDSQTLREFSVFDRDRFTNPKEAVNETAMSFASCIVNIMGEKNELATKDSTKLTKLISREVAVVKSQYVGLAEACAAVVSASQVELDVAILNRGMAIGNTLQAVQRDPKFDAFKFVVDFPLMAVLIAAKKRELAAKASEAWVALSLL